MRQIDLIVVHCADTPADMDIGVAEIRKWHTDPKPKGRGWSDIGYHYVIRRDGTVEEGRPVETPGAHVKGHNQNSIGVCMVGGKGGANFTFAQYDDLEYLLRELTKKYPDARICGHRDLDDKKTCPNFDVKAFWEHGR